MMDKDNDTGRIVKRDSIFQGEYLKLERLKISLPDGRSGVREVVCVPDAVAVLPVDENRIVHLVRQHRPAIGRTLIEIPAGLLDGGEDVRDGALRECEEEIGYCPRVLKELITYAHAEGYSTGFITLFLGTDLEHTGKMNLDATEFLEPISMPFDELIDLVRKNQIIDSKTILSTLLCEHLL